MTNPSNGIRETFFQRLDHPLLVEDLFDHVLDITFFIKDHHGRYIVANKTLWHRCGATSKEEMIGKTADEIFPAPLGAAFASQDDPLCGDDIVDGPQQKPIFSGAVYDEQCDDGDGNADADGAICRTDCTAAACNDGIADPTVLGEDCDRCIGDSSGSPCTLTEENWEWDAHMGPDEEEPEEDNMGLSMEALVREAEDIPPRP